MLTYKTKIEGNNLYLIFEGDIDIEATELFQDEIFPLISEEHTKYELSFSDVGFVDSTGIGFILHLIERIKHYDRLVNITSIQRDVYEVFNMLQIDEIVGKEVFDGIQIL